MDLIILKTNDATFFIHETNRTHGNETIHKRRESYLPRHTFGTPSGLIGVIKSTSTSNGAGPSLRISSSTFSPSILLFAYASKPKMSFHKVLSGPFSTQPIAICWTPRILKGRIFAAVVENRLRLQTFLLDLLIVVEAKDTHRFTNILSNGEEVE